MSCKAHNWILSWAALEVEIQKLQHSAHSPCSLCLKDAYPCGVRRNIGTMYCWMLARFKYWWKDKTHFALGWLPCLLMLITSHAQHFRGHLERAETWFPPGPALLLPLPLQGNIAGSETSICASAKQVPGDCQGCCAMRVLIIQGRVVVVVLLTGRFLHTHLLFCTCAKVSLKTCRTAAFTDTLYTLAGYKCTWHVHVCTSSSSSGKFCSLSIVL